MRFRDVRIVHWTFWAFFDWRGRIKRIPYAVGYCVLVLLSRLYVNTAALWIAVNVAPPPAGAVADAAYVAALSQSPRMTLWLFPVCYILTVFDIKRLRSIGAPVLLAVLFSGFGPLVPLYAKGIAEMAIMTSFAYHAILALMPAREDRMSPAEKRAQVWKSLVSGNGSPRYLNKKEIRAWRVAGMVSSWQYDLYKNRAVGAEYALAKSQVSSLRQEKIS